MPGLRLSCIETVDARQCRNPCGKLAVARMSLLVPPAVEVEIDGGDADVCLANEDRAAVARPHVVGRDIDKLDLRPAEAGSQTMLVRRGGHGNGLVFRDRRGKPAERFLNTFEIGAGAVVEARCRRPGHPCSLVRLGFGGNSYHCDILLFGMAAWCRHQCQASGCQKKAAA
jgi:hypothetical protein